MLVGQLAGAAAMFYGGGQVRAFRWLVVDETRVARPHWPRPATRAMLPSMADTLSLPERPAAPARKKFTWADVDAMMRAGIIDEGGPEELLDGEIWVMPAEGEAHIDLKTWLNETLIKSAPGGVGVACDTTLRLSDTHAPSPDFFVFPKSMKASAARGPDVLLLIEIADTSRKKDLKIKGPKYREYGLREYWVIDLEKRVTYVHRLDGAWPQVPPLPFDTELAPAFASSLHLKLADSGV